MRFPDGPDGAGDETQRAAGGLEVGDVGQPLGEEADQLGVERVAGADLLGVVGLERPPLDGHARLLLRLVVSGERGRHVAGVFLLDLLEQAAAQHGGPLVRLRRGQVLGLPPSRVADLVHGLQHGRDVLLQFAGQLAVGVLLGRQRHDDDRPGPL